MSSQQNLRTLASADRVAIEHLVGELAKLERAQTEDRLALARLMKAIDEREATVGRTEVALNGELLNQFDALAVVEVRGALFRTGQKRSDRARYLGAALPDVTYDDDEFGRHDEIGEWKADYARSVFPTGF